MDRPAIVIRDIHHYGDDLTVPEAIARLRHGGQVTVTVTDPAPRGGDPRGNPRHGFDITVRPAPGRQPELPPEVSCETRSFQTPDSAALFAGVLSLASQLAACAGPVLAAVEDPFFTAGGQALFAEAERIRPRTRRPALRHEQPARRDVRTPPGGRKPGHRSLIGNQTKERLP